MHPRQYKNDEKDAISSSSFFFRLLALPLTWPVSVSNLYNRSPGLLEPTFCFLGVTDGAIIIQETGLPASVKQEERINNCKFA